MKSKSNKSKKQLVVSEARERRKTSLVNNQIKNNPLRSDLKVDFELEYHERGKAKIDKKSLKGEDISYATTIIETLVLDSFDFAPESSLERQFRDLVHKAADLHEKVEADESVGQGEVRTELIKALSEIAPSTNFISSLSEKKSEIQRLTAIFGLGVWAQIVLSDSYFSENDCFIAEQALKAFGTTSTSFRSGVRLGASLHKSSSVLKPVDQEREARIAAEREKISAEHESLFLYIEQVMKEKEARERESFESEMNKRKRGRPRSVAQAV